MYTGMQIVIDQPLLGRASFLAAERESLHETQLTQLLDVEVAILHLAHACYLIILTSPEHLNAGVQILHVHLVCIAGSTYT
jgi:hypothetical protein